MNYRQKYLSACLLGIAALASGAFPAFADGRDNASSLGTASGFAVLSAPTDTATAKVTLTDSTVTGNVGSAGAATTVTITPPSTVTGTITAPVSAQVVRDFHDAYAALAPTAGECNLAHTLAATIPVSVMLAPGTYCTSAALAATDVTLTLSGQGVYIFKIGTSGTGGTGALTGTNFKVALVNGASACNVTWWVSQAATMTNSDFNGILLAGANIKLTGTSGGALPGGTGSGGLGSFTGKAFAGATAATGAVTLTDMTLVGCATQPPPPPSCDRDHKHHKHCKHNEHDKPHCDGDGDHDGHDGDDDDGHGNGHDGHDDDNGHGSDHDSPFKR